MITSKARLQVRNFLITLGCFSAFCLLNSCISVDKPYKKLAPGIWRATLKIDNKPVDTEFREPTLESIGKLQMKSITEGELPFIFEVKYSNPDSFYIVFYNATEEIVIGDIAFGRNKKTAYDTIRIDFPIYDSYISANIVGPVMEGFWVVNYKRDKNGIYKIPFKAEFGKDERFADLRLAPSTDVTGNWKIQFIDQEPYPGIMELEQNGNKLYGTIRTETGDYRYLEGLIQDKKIYLSVFDGSHAFLIEGQLLNDQEMFGTFASGKHYKVSWTAQKSDRFELTDPYRLTKMIQADRPFRFNFSNPSGKMVSLEDPEFAGKVKIIEIMGTWCPNCRDANRFLKEMYSEFGSDDLAIVAIAFERYRDEQKAKEKIQSYKMRAQIPFPILYGGYADKKEAQKKLPQLDRIRSYPTLLILDRDNKVHKIYTGFNGPATSKYAEFKQAFISTVRKLINA